MGLNNENYFGGSSKKSVKGNRHLLEVEKKNKEAMFVVLSDVWLDIPQVRRGKGRKCWPHVFAICLLYTTTQE